MTSTHETSGVASVRGFITKTHLLDFGFQRQALERSVNELFKTAEKASWLWLRCSHVLLSVSHLLLFMSLEGSDRHRC